MRALSLFFLRPVYLLRAYRRANLQPDMLAGLTVAVVLLPQALVFSLLAGLPPQMGIYTAVTAGIVGAFWGSSSHLNTGPTNSASVLVLSILAPLAAPGTPPFMAAAGMLAVMAGLLRIAMGLARLGILVNFVSDSVIVGFTAGAGVDVYKRQAMHSLQRYPTSVSRTQCIHMGRLHLLQRSMVSTRGWLVQKSRSSSSGAAVACVSRATVAAATGARR